VRLESTNRRVDVIREGFDLAIRVRFPPLEDSDLVIRKFADSSQCLVARAFSEKAESEEDSHVGTNMIQASCWEEASMDGEAVFGGLA